MSVISSPLGSMEECRRTTMVRFISHCLFDGWISCNAKRGVYRIGYSNKTHVLIEQFINDVKILYGIDLRSKARERKGVHEVEFFSKLITDDVLNIISLRKVFLRDSFSVLLADKKLSVVVLRAFWDDEGTVDFYSRKRLTRKLRVRCSNKLLREQMLRLHKSLGINASEEYDKKGIIISNRDGIRMFRDEIGFTRGVKVLNGNMRSSTWLGRNKSEVLELMLDSFL